MSDRSDGRAAEGLVPDLARYEQLMGVVRQRLTSRQFNPAIPVPREHIEMVLEKTLPQIMSWDRFNMANYMTVEQIDAWVREERHKVMYRDESKID